VIIDGFYLAGMRRLTVTTSLLFALFSANAQDASIMKIRLESMRNIGPDPADTSKKTWRSGGQYSLNVGQGSLNNWAAGGDEFTLTIASTLNLYAFLKKDRHSWDNTFDVNFGYLKTTSLGSRKNDDRFDLLSKYGFLLTEKRLSLAGLVNFRSQFLKGYAYTDSSKKVSSSFLSPGYVLVSLGLDYKPTKNLSIFVSPVSSRWVIVKDDTLSAHGAYGVKPGKKSISEWGAFATINYLKEFNKFVTYKGRLDLFSNYKHKPQNIDVYMTNSLTAKIAKIIAFSWSVDLIYDDDVKLFGPNKTSPALQLKSIIGAGLQLKF